MNVTKYPQSCLVIEQNGKRIVIDPGSVVASKHDVQDLLPLDAILITHEHQDHADPDLINSIIERVAIPVVANRSTASVIGHKVTRIINDGDNFEVAGIKVNALELPHCLLTDGSPGPQNTGYVIDGVFFHPGDGIAIDNLRVPAAAIPIAGPDISPKDVFDFIKQLQCQTVIPMHYDYFLEDAQLLAHMAISSMPSLKFVVLKDGQSVQL